MAAKQLYQLLSKKQLAAGAYVAVNGPWDRFGVVTSSKPYEGSFLNQIRGCEKRQYDKPVAQF